MILHTLNLSPGVADFLRCLEMTTTEDTVLLLGEGVYGCLPGSEAEAALVNCKGTVLVLADDAIAAGVPCQRFQHIDMDAFITLTERYTKQLAWY